MKAGNRVKIVNGPYIAPELQKGKCGWIISMEEDGYIEVEMESGYSDDNGDVLWPFCRSELEVVD